MLAKHLHLMGPSDAVIGERLRRAWARDAFAFAYILVPHSVPNPAVWRRLEMWGDPSE